jgi:hypothetical protein
MDLSPVLKIRNMLHWDKISFQRERGEKTLAKKQTPETTMEMELHIHCRGDGVLML